MAVSIRARRFVSSNTMLCSWPIIYCYVQTMQCKLPYCLDNTQHTMSYDLSDPLSDLNDDCAVI
eukprot:scaffold393_cov71-Cylindrotheca_fusiformis.AAC.1